MVHAMPAKKPDIAFHKKAAWSRSVQLGLINSLQS